MLKIIGAGLSRTGTNSLRNALEMLGFSCIHYDRTRLNDILDGSTPNPDFRRYDDVDAVADLPSAYFYRELMQAYPGSKVILTVREIDAWWKSISTHFTVHGVPETSSIRQKLSRRLGLSSWLWKEDEHDVFRRTLRLYVYGSTTPKEFLYKKKYADYNDQVVATVPPERLLIMDIAAGDGWDKLCPFLGAPVPDQAFPHTHKTDYANPAPWRAQAR